ncbi:hypothetical protein, partial [Burkholderia pseudomallei]|uniref:hypothetical protein n=1 Tax=Burkholderia pseudomallei TaxID=28450 RepID=UPI001955324B
RHPGDERHEAFATRTRGCCVRTGIVQAARKAARKTRPARRIARTIRVVRRAVLRSLYGQRRRTF